MTTVNNESDALVPKRKIDSFLATRDEAIRLFHSAIVDLSKAELLLQQSGFAQYAVASQFNGKGLYGLSNPERYVDSFRRSVDRDLWHHLGLVSGLLQLMDVTAQKEWKTSVDSNSPECTRDNIEATFARLHEQQKLIFHRGLVRAFQVSRGAFSSNDCFKIGERLKVEQYNTGSVADIERCLCLLDDTPVPDYNQSIAAMINNREILSNSFLRVEGDTVYFHYIQYKNGNVHLQFKRLDLIERCNQIIAAFFGSSVLP